tara:strand:- start:20633 stop:20803 length:171 start_codon:yes stop_codon:yes gene_type:complete
MTDWTEACDPVPRRELTPAEKRRLQALMELRRRQGFRRPNAPSVYRVDDDFDEMGA